MNGPRATEAKGRKEGRNSIFASQGRVAEWRLGTKVANSPKQVQWWFCVFSNRVCSIYLSASQNGPVTQPRTRCVRGHAAHLIFLKVTNCKKISSLDNGAHSSYPGDVCFGAVREREVKSMSARDANVTEGIWHLPTTKPRLLFGWLVGSTQAAAEETDLVSKETQS